MGEKLGLSHLRESFKSRSSVLRRHVDLCQDTIVSEVHFTLKMEAAGLPKRWYRNTTLHGVTTQKTSTWNITAAKASELEEISVFQNRVLRRMSGWGL